MNVCVHLRHLRLETLDHWTTDHTLSLIPACLMRCASGQVLSPRVLVTGILIHTCLRFLAHQRRTH
jgi:hypothetical protein